jgi:hypothetical protein
LFLAVAPWVLFDIVSAQHPQAMLVGLGLIVMVVSFCGGVAVIVGLVSLLRTIAARQRATE